MSGIQPLALARIVSVSPRCLQRILSVSPLYSYRCCCLRQVLPVSGGNGRPVFFALPRFFTNGKESLSSQESDSSSHGDNKGTPTHESHSSSPGDNGTQNFSKASSSSQSDGSVEQDSWPGFEDDSEDSEKDYEHSVRQKILSASLNHVHEYGWTNNALEAGARSQGLPSVAHGMFPRGGAEIVEYFYARSNDDLTEYMKQEVDRLKADNVEKLKTGPFIKNALETRLKMILPYKDIWAQAMGLQTLPQNTVQSWKNLMHLSDEIWHYAGDKSVDFNWYTKRTTLAAVYKATEIYMLQDTSLDQKDTWDFLDRRLADVQKLGMASRQLNLSGSTLKESLDGLCTMGRNIFGLNSRNR